jgi:p-hydroxybenzoate 3-monooxygenase
MKTDVAIIGSGPSGLLLGHLLRQAGIDTTIVERRSAPYVLSRIRAGVLERTTTDLLDQLGLDARKNDEGLRHDGFCMLNHGELVRIDCRRLVDKYVTVYGQTELTRDLIDAAPDRGLPILWEVEDVALHDLDTERPHLTFKHNGADTRLDARFIAGCDGFHGVARQAIPAAAGAMFEREYPFGWLGVLADVPPCHEEILYARHQRGFALASMRSHTRSRYYIQTPLDTRLEDWPDERFWDELTLRLGAEAGAHVVRGASIEKSIAPLRSFVFEPMRYHNLFLAGDAAHIVPPTGAKGLNLAASDVAYLSEAFIGFFRDNRTDLIDGYSARALARVWKSERFSWYLTSLLHHFPEHSEFEKRMQDAEFDYIRNSVAAQTTLAENYVGLPL